PASFGPSWPLVDSARPTSPSSGMDLSWRSCARPSTSTASCPFALSAPCCMRAVREARSAPVASAVSLDAVDVWIAALGAVPPAARVYDVTPRRAEVEFGITSAIADLLSDRGLPRSSFEGETRFAWSDLHYIALRLGSARLYLRTMRSWA